MRVEIDIHPYGNMRMLKITATTTTQKKKKEKKQRNELNYVEGRNLYSHCATVQLLDGWMDG